VCQFSALGWTDIFFSHYRKRKKTESCDVY